MQYKYLVASKNSWKELHVKCIKQLRFKVDGKRKSLFRDKYMYMMLSDTKLLKIRTVSLNIYVLIVTGNVRFESTEG